MLTKKKLVEMASSMVPESMQDDIVAKPITSALTTMSFIMALPILGKVGMVSALGWYIVYGVCIGSFSIELCKTTYKAYRKLKKDERKEVQDKLDLLKNARNEGQITSEEYKSQAKALLEEVIRAKSS
ncbi:hypothetical protein [Vibrio owensii]|uniref:hypothetical protein n=1 Tax=Vibrio harveyi group TaxID=717610 RepID=UPI003CC64D5C